MVGLVWDITAGQRTSLLSSYIRYRPDLYLLGGDIPLSSPVSNSAVFDSASSSDNQKPERSCQRLTDIPKTGWLSHVANLGPAGCLAAVSIATEGIVRALHELAATERAFFNKLNRLCRHFVSRIPETDIYEKIEASVHGAALTKLFKMYSHIQKMVSVLHHELYPTCHVISRVSL